MAGLADLLDDVVSLRAWLDRSLMAVQGRVDEGPMEQLLAKLQNTAGRPVPWYREPAGADGPGGPQATPYH